MRRLVALSTIFALLLTGAPLMAAGASSGARGGARQDQTGTVKATAKDAQGQTLPNYTVRIRNLLNGNLTGSTTSSATGEATFAGLPPGNYALEIVNATGDIVGTSAAIAVTAGTTVTVTVTASAAAALAGTGGGVAAGGSGTGVSNALIITAVAGAAGVVALVVAANRGTASPSR